MSGFDSLSTPLKRLIHAYTGDEEYVGLWAETKIVEYLIMFDFNLVMNEYKVRSLNSRIETTIQKYIENGFLNDFIIHFPDYCYIFRWLLNNYPPFINICNTILVRWNMRRMRTRRGNGRRGKGRKIFQTIIKMYVASEWPLEKFVQLIVDSTQMYGSKPLDKKVYTQTIIYYLQSGSTGLLQNK